MGYMGILLNIVEAVFYLLKGDYRVLVQGLVRIFVVSILSVTPNHVPHWGV